ncbi:MAG TPA: peptidoglycan DD-metalloendopeptidase family protein [Clostridiales bacterium]|nr:peptidoglycan DD-metalloendopeptidase family protein [Clostridiales bacterium]
MKKQKRFITLIAVLLVLILLVPILTVLLKPLNARAVSESELYQLQQQQAQIKQQQEEIQAKLDSAQYERAAILDRKEILDRQAELTRQEIANLSTQIATYENLIAIKEDEYQAALQDEERQRELFKRRVRAMEENGEISYLAILFGAKDFGDLLSRLDFISEIMESDEQVIKSYQKAQAEANNKKNELEEMKNGLVAAKTLQEEKAAELDSQITQAVQLIADLENNIAQNAQLIEEAEAAEQELAQKILEMTRELERQRQQQGGGIVSSTGRYIWPSNSSKYVTSPYGMREDPIIYTWRMHNGIDIGASYGTDILASDSGEVVTATYSSSYGYYVMLYHGDDRYTLYAHMSEIWVDEGEYVYQGDVIGLVGSTGYSTGPHIHFEIMENGSRVDPLQFFGDDYIPWW